jgi:hypothetical protein
MRFQDIAEDLAGGGDRSAGQRGRCAPRPPGCAPISSQLREHPVQRRDVGRVAATGRMVGDDLPELRLQLDDVLLRVRDEERQVGALGTHDAFGVRGRGDGDTRSGTPLRQASRLPSCAHGDHGPERAGRDRGEAINREGGRYGSERHATMNAASLTGVMERRATVAAGMTVTSTASVTAGVTDVITMISSALRRR